MTTYEQVHAGDAVLGHDGQPWGVSAIVHGDQLAVTLVRGEHEITGRPPAGTEVQIIEPADLSAEVAAAGVLIEALGPIEIISERWER